MPPETIVHRSNGVEADATRPTCQTENQRNMRMTQAIQNEIDREKDRLSRIEALLSVMPPHQIKRLDEVKRQGELAIARRYGHRLNHDVALRVVENLTLDPSVQCTIGGGVNELPGSAEGWDSFMKTAVEKEPLAMLALDYSDAALKEKIRTEERAKLKPREKMAMAHAGTLDTFLDKLVQERLAARHN
jgi:hypothetical protein